MDGDEHLEDLGPTEGDKTAVLVTTTTNFEDSVSSDDMMDEVTPVRHSGEALRAATGRSHMLSAVKDKISPPSEGEVLLKTATTVDLTAPRRLLQAPVSGASRGAGVGVSATTLVSAPVKRSTSLANRLFRPFQGFGSGDPLASLPIPVASQKYQIDAITMTALDTAVTNTMDGLLTGKGGMSAFRSP
jgi:hypothetical protein